MRSVIVCVDDEWNILKTLSDQLRRNVGKAYDIELAEGGEEALSLCAQLKAEGKDIALIISDQRMAGMEGDALLIQLHALYPKTLKIMLTGQADADSVGNVVNQAALYRYIRKPWDETDLILTVTEALRRFQQEQQLVEQNELLKTINTKLENSLSLLLATLEATADGMLVLDNLGAIASFNRKLLSIWQLEDLELTQDKNRLLDAILARLVASDVAKFQALFARVDTEKHDFLQLQNGSIIEYYLQPYQLAGESMGGVLSFRDVTQAKQMTAIIQHQALHDALTNLPNRVLFNQKLTATLTEAVGGAKLGAVMFLDLDRFKQVNDTLGHAVGDLLLQQVVHRLVNCLREVDVIARWGGDEFVLLLPQIRRPQDASDIAGRLIEVLQPEFLLQNHRLHISASIGIAVYPRDGLDSHALLHHADVALYQAKNSGRNQYQHYFEDDVEDDFEYVTLHWNQFIPDGYDLSR
ncbi:MAG: diguanylate cyclase [Leptolyngbyaceae cyanobacterium bins.349]|nr:diguanylate cyclase [Leptolyngbyaceae cyanobacterium bins.349]